MFKLFGITLFRAHSYGVIHALAFVAVAILLILFIYRRYHRLVQKDRAAKSVQRTNVFVVVDSGGGDDGSSSMKDLENMSDEDDDDVDYAKLLRELDTPNNFKENDDDDSDTTPLTRPLAAHSDIADLIEKALRKERNALDDRIVQLECPAG